ncbi:EF-Hand 1, calcium-binding site [Phytophthora cactorum]|nr:EF-Hand 1, calcium-binding site [Phytophthora cactorum]
MLDRVSWEPETVVSFIEDLIELFAQVDVNGDGTMEWEEFTSAIIEGGMGSFTTRKFTSVVELLDPTGLFPPESDDNGKDAGSTSEEKDSNVDSHMEDSIATAFSFTQLYLSLTSFTRYVMSRDIDATKTKCGQNDLQFKL